MSRYSLAVVLACLLATPVTAQLPPDEALKAFTVAEGLQIELFASEPMFVNPTCIDVDHRGRVWVCESVNYRCDLHKKPRNRAEGDRIVVLEDTDGDGKADKAVTFYQSPDFIAPLGIAVAPQPSSALRKAGDSLKVYVCHSPHIYLFEDKDGDLKADGPPKILLTGFNGYDHDHGVHGIHFGPDGKLYFSCGDTGVRNLSSSNGDIKPNKETRGHGDAETRGADKEKGRRGDKETSKKVWTSNSTDCRAGTIWRCNADGSGLELIAHNFRNQYEPAVDSFGTIFVSDNDDDGNQQTRICYVMPGGNYGYHPRGPGQSHWHEEQPGVVHKVLRTWFGSPTGMCWYEAGQLVEALLPKTKVEGFYSVLLHTEAGPREVRCYIVKMKGAGYELDQHNLVESTDNWFRPSDVCVAPDGSVFVSDWYDPGVGGHGMGDTTRGRIYRLARKGSEGYRIPQLDLPSPNAIVTAMASPNLASRHLGLLEIKLLPNEKLGPVLQPILGKNPDQRLRFRGFWALNQLVGLEGIVQDSFRDTKLPAVFLSGAEEGLYLRWIKERYGKMSDAPELMKEIVGTFLKNLSIAYVRRELLLCLRDSDVAFAKDKIYVLATSYPGNDHFYLAAIGIAVGTDPKRREVILADFEKHFPEWNDKVADLVWELRPPQVIAKLDQRLADAKLTPAQKGRIIDILAVSEQPEAGRNLLKIVAGEFDAELREAALKNLQTHLPGKWRSIAKSEELRGAIEKLLAAKTSRPSALSLIVASSQEDMVDKLLKIAMDEEETTTTRSQAAKSLAALKTDASVKALVTLLAVEVVNRDAVEALGKLGNGAAIAELQRLVADEKQPVDMREAAVAGLAGSRSGTNWLLEAHAKKELPAVLAPEAGWILRNSPYPDLRNKALIAFPGAEKIDPKKRIDLTSLPRMRKLWNSTGDILRGRELFFTNKELACSRCHLVQGLGGQIGPDLSLIGKKGSKENLFESILFPDRAVADQFVQYVIETKDGNIVVGIVIQETPEFVLLRDALGKDYKIGKNEIENRARSPKSIMPGDLVQLLTEQDLVDVVEYMSMLKQPLFTVGSWQFIGPFDNLANNAGLDKPYAPEMKVDLAGVYDGKDGKVKWMPITPEANGYFDLIKAVGPKNDNTVSYVYAEIESPVEQDVLLVLGVDEMGKGWVNGKLVYDNKVPRPAAPAQDFAKARLVKGKNTVLLKINNGVGGHGFYFQVAAEGELKGIK